MGKPFVFISYKHAEPWSKMVELLDQKLRNIAPAFNYEVFVDKRMKAGVLWSKEVDQALEKTTHFIAMLCDPYWASDECRRELHAVVRRYEASARSGEPGPQLLFVRAGEMDPRFFTFDEARQSGALSVGDPQIDKLSDVNFLGPFNLKNVGSLETLAWNEPGRLDEQLGQLRDRFKDTL